MMHYEECNRVDLRQLPAQLLGTADGRSWKRQIAGLTFSAGSKPTGTPLSPRGRAWGVNSVLLTNKSKGTRTE